MLPDYGELKYCLRSIEKHLSNVENIYLVGVNMPRWGKDMFQIICGDKEGKEYHEWNIYNKIKVACSVGAVGEEFLFMNDDHFLLEDFDADTFPYFYDGLIKDGYSERDSSYQRTRRNTGTAISPECKFFDVHCPIRYNKTNFEKVMRLDWKKDYGYLIKSMYCNLNQIIGEPGEDTKIGAVSSEFFIRKHVLGKRFFSTSDNCWDEGGALLQIMEELYPNKSRWEK